MLKVHVDLQMRNFILVILLFLINTLSFAQTNLLKADSLSLVDQMAEFPGGQSAFYNYISRHLVYPGISSIKGKEGRVLVQFIVDENGHIVKPSVKSINGFDEHCDFEAVKVIRECPTVWKPAIKDNKNIAQQFILPITFKHNLNDSVRAYMMQMEEFSAKTIVINKPGTPKIKDWQLYADLFLTVPIGYLSPGDTVNVIGWGPRLVGIQKGYRIGYLSWKAILVTKELEPVMKMIEEDTPAFEKVLMRADSLNNSTSKKLQTTSNFVRNRFKSDSEKLYFSKMQGLNNAFLGLSSTKKNIVVGECAVVDLSFYISTENKRRLQFHNLGPQLSGLINDYMRAGPYWTSSNNMVEIEQEYIPLNNLNFSKYTLYVASYCPVSTKSIILPSLTLTMKEFESSIDSAGIISSFTSFPLEIQVLPMPEQVYPSKSDFYTMAGVFEIKDTVSSKSATIHEELKYTIEIKGEGLTYPLQPPALKFPNAIIRLVETIHADTIVNNRYQSRRSFTYSILFSKPGIYNFGDVLKFKVYNPKLKIVEEISSKHTLQVTNSFQHEQISTNKSPLLVTNKMIAVDISQSMMIEDYQPFRLAIVKQAIIDFLKKRKECDFRLLLFGSDAINYNPEVGSLCYTSSDVELIDFGLSGGGTSIGNAIWQSVNSLTARQANKKIVIIGDGDNTSGNLTIDLAIAFAKKKGVKIYTIGVGNKGPVQFGKDFLGNPNLVSDTFSDKDFRRIALETRGEYFWAKDKESITTALVDIFKE